MLFCVKANLQPFQFFNNQLPLFYMILDEEFSYMSLDIA